jgi:hypothetical protein
MKQRDFLHHLAVHGCAKAADTLSTTIRRPVRRRAFLGTQKSMIFLRGRFVAISVFLTLNKTDFYFSKYSCKNSTVA